MSSSTRSRGETRRAPAGLVLAACAWLGLSGIAAADDVSIVTVLRSGGSTRMVVDIEPAPDRAVAGSAFAVSAGQVAVPATVTPLLSPELAVGLVVDASAAGAGALAPGLSGAADLLLQLPAGARVAVVADARPAAVRAELAPGPAGALAALDALRPGGRRDTSAAITLAAAQLPERSTGPRVLVLYTGAADAGREPANDLAARLSEARVVLAVVSTSAETSYWSQVAQGTGGTMVHAAPDDTIGAFGAVADTLRARYQLTFRMPTPAPPSIAVSVATAAGTLTAEASIASGRAATPPAPEEPTSGWLRWALIAAAAAFLLGNAAVLTFYFRRRRARRSPAPPEAIPPPADRPPNTGTPNTGTPNTGTPNTGTPNTGTPNTGTPNTGTPNTGTPNTGVPTAGRPPNTGVPNTGLPMAGVPNTGPPTSRPPGPYEVLDTTVAQAAEAVENGDLDVAKAIARIAIAALGRTDLLDRLTASEHRIAGSRLATWPPTSTILGLLLSARLVTNGEAVLTGPDRIRVQQTRLSEVDTTPVFRLSRAGEWICDCPSIAELATHVDIDTLTATRPTS